VLEADEGRNNANFDISRARLIRGASYMDQSTIAVVPTREDGMIHGKVADSFANAIKPMNQPYAKYPFEMFRVAGHEVGQAYNAALEAIRADPNLSTWTFLCTAEFDNVVPPDGLLQLQAAMYANADKDDDGRILKDSNGVPKFHFLGIGGLYWTKHFNEKDDPHAWFSQPMIYGHPQEPLNFRPQLPLVDAVQECHGIAMGWSIFNLQALLKDERLGPPWFETHASWSPMSGAKCATQDLSFCSKARQLGYRFAVNTACKVGHMDLKTGIVW
jgi:hypothetical protein